MDFLQNVSGFQIGMVAVAGVLLLLIYKGDAAWKWLTTPSAPAVTDSADPDIADMLALKRLTKRFATLNCKEGSAAMEVAAQHFFHGTGSP